MAEQKNVFLMANHKTGMINLYVNGTPYMRTNATEKEVADIEVAFTAAEHTGFKKKSLEKVIGLVKGIDIPSYEEIDIKFSNGNLLFKDEPVPIDFAEHLKDYLARGVPIDAFLKFWQWMKLNPVPEVQNRLFTHCIKFGVPITQYGYMIMYKAVAHKQKASSVDKDLKDFLSESWMKIKSQKKSPKRFGVFKNKEDHSYFYAPVYDKDGNLDEDYSAFTNKEFHFSGNLDDLYDKLTLISGETVYTDKHTKTMDIIIGKPCPIDGPIPFNEDYNSINDSCGTYIHVGAPFYVRSFADVGDSVLAVLVNPMYVRSVPLHQDSKMQVQTYFPFALMEINGTTVLKKGESVWREGNVVPKWEAVDVAYFEHDYKSIEDENLKAKLKRLKAIKSKKRSDAENKQIQIVESLLKN